MKNKPLFILISSLSFLATILVVWRIFFAQKSVPPSPVFPLVTPTLTPQPTPFVGRGDPDIEKEIQKETQKKYPLLQFVPYQTPSWKIDYLGPLYFEVILKADTPQIRREVLDWIGSKGINPDTHQIKWQVGP